FFDLDPYEEKWCAQFEDTRHAREGRRLITARKVKHHPHRNCRIEAAVYERTLANVSAHGRRTRQIGLKAGKHSNGAVETNHAIARVHERLGDRHAVAAADVQNA